MRITFVAFLLGAWLAPVASASEAPPAPPPAQALWELGAVGIGLSQQAYPGAEEDVSRAALLPYAIYRGNWLRADRDTVGLRALKTERLELDLGLGGSLGARSSRIAARDGMPRLGHLVELGPRLQLRLGEAVGGRWKLELPLRAVFDASDDFRHRGASFEPELVFERRTRGGLAYSARLGGLWGDRQLADTFYGVAPGFATALRPAYEAEAGRIAWRLATSASLPLNADWRVFGFARWQTVSGAANAASPLVRRDGGWAAGMGLSYVWKRSSRLAGD
jgi:MipA family protein